MNPKLTPQEFEACLLSLEGALVLARAGCWSKDMDRVEALLDAFHNLPRLLLGEQPGWPTGNWTLDGHNEMFLKPLLVKYPTLRGSGVDVTLAPEPEDVH